MPVFGTDEKLYGLHDKDDNADRHGECERNDKRVYNLRTTALAGSLTS